jgi:hypothetical protein
VGLLLAVGSEGGLQSAADEGDLDDRVEAHHHGTDRKGVRADRGQCQYVRIRADDGPAGRQRIGGGSRGGAGYEAIATSNSMRRDASPRLRTKSFSAV